MDAVTLRMPRPASAAATLALVIVAPAVATLAIPAGSPASPAPHGPFLALGLATLIGVLAWVTARALTCAGRERENALLCALAVALLAPMAVSALVPALLGILWLVRPARAVAANDNTHAGDEGTWHWQPVAPPHSHAETVRLSASAGRAPSS